MGPPHLPFPLQPPTPLLHTSKPAQDSAAAPNEASVWEWLLLKQHARSSDRVSSLTTEAASPLYCWGCGLKQRFSAWTATAAMHQANHTTRPTSGSRIYQGSRSQSRSIFRAVPSMKQGKVAALGDRIHQGRRSQCRSFFPACPWHTVDSPSGNQMGRGWRCGLNHWASWAWRSEGSNPHNGVSSRCSVPAPDNLAVRKHAPKKCKSINRYRSSRKVNGVSMRCSGFGVPLHQKWLSHAGHMTRKNCLRTNAGSLGL